jgi:hypothetical protein
MHADRRLIQVTRVEKLDTKWQSLLQPQGFVVPKLNLPVSIVVQSIPLQRFGQHDFRRLKGLFRSRSSLVDDRVERDLQASWLARGRFREKQK